MRAKNSTQSSLMGDVGGVGDDVEKGCSGERVIESIGMPTASVRAGSPSSPSWTSCVR
jgi:hypothetical protein